MTFWRFVIAAGCLALSAPVWAQGDGGTPVPESAPAPEVSAEFREGIGTVLVRTALVLGFVVALVYLSLNFGLRRLMGVRAIPAGRASVVSVLERVPLSQRHSLFVVQAAGEYLLLGSGDAGVSLVTKLDRETVDQLQQTAARPASPFLEKLLSKRNPS